MAADKRYLWGEGAAADGDYAGAADLFRQALELAPLWPAGWFAFAKALIELGALDEAARAFRTCLAVNPADTFGAALHLARLSPEQAGWAIPGAYVEQLFDDYADRFDTHLNGILHYRGPALIRAALLAEMARQRRDPHFKAVLDLGCGTGLMAVALAGIADIIDGVDISRRMLEKARATNRYRKLDADDLVGHLVTLPAGLRYSLATAADVLVYIGDLGPLFAAVRSRLPIGSFFAFTVQSHQGRGFALGKDLRAAHSEAYLLGIAVDSGFSVRSFEAGSSRMDAGIDVPGYVVVLET